MSQTPSSRKPAGGCLRIVLGLLLALPAANALVLFVPMLTEGFPATATEEERLLLRLFTGAAVLMFGGGSIALIVSGGRSSGRRSAPGTARRSWPARQEIPLRETPPATPRARGENVSESP